MAKVIVENTLNGLSVEVLAIVDTGADQTCLSANLMHDLDIYPETMAETTVGGIEGDTIGLDCDFIRIAFLELKSLKKHYPNGGKIVPAHFAYGHYTLLGLQGFLDRCLTTFDGPNQKVYIDF